MIKIENKEACCGCNVCGDICPKDAITFKIDNEGFWYPEVNKDKCIDCHLCERVCPVIHADELKNNDYKEPLCFAVQHKNLESLFNSTSGSAFAGLAEAMYKRGGYVGGAIFNEDFSVRQYISAEKKDLDIIRNSKYVQSDSRGFYKEVKLLLDKGNQVLVCSLPCQIAALKAFLKKDYDNLITVDLICRNINSTKVFKSYIGYLEETYSSRVKHIKHKNKELGWRQLTIKVEFENGKILYDTKDTSYFTFGFISTSVFCRPCCYDCKFKGFPRIADITIGDFWTAKSNIGDDFDHDLGTSVVLLNSERGKKFFENSKNLRSIPIDFNTILPGNKALTESAFPALVDREQFYNDLDTMSFKNLAKKYIHVPTDRSRNSKKIIKNILKFGYFQLHACDWSLATWIKNLHYNFFSKHIFGVSILDGRYMIIEKHCVFNIGKDSKIQLGGIFHFGIKRARGSKLESRLILDPRSTLITNGNVNISYGADIEVFTNAVLEFGSGCHTNINPTIICGEKITIGNNVAIGRDVTIRDNNGSHYISRKAYKTSHPIVIGQHSWLCEHSVILPGTKLGTGVIVTACSVVSGRHKSFTMLNGNPAQVVDEDIYWKE